MQSTGARIQLSMKGDYIPGTYNRKLTIAGPISVSSSCTHGDPPEGHQGARGFPQTGTYLIVFDLSMKPRGGLIH